ncbi:hypothetical protein AB1Y20_002109 [Prymnesium parvum]|uniref:Phosphatidic acid phosphatase type 2/haloperoxidase domain-containing protein n=1 Tax=Prymnesium parvum TaxID=97485 RepID=A0AB34J9F7_PRYPA
MSSTHRRPWGILFVIVQARALVAPARFPLAYARPSPRRLPFGMTATDPLPTEQSYLNEEAAADDDLSQPGPLVALHLFEYRLLRAIQQAPGMLHLSLGVHYSLLPKVITPLLALIVWLISLPAGASLITFVCASDLLNTAVKWAVQRPRPRWYSQDAGLVDRCGAWEVDLSFPSAHTQFFAGLFACSCALAGPTVPTWIAIVLGFVIGLTRNYLSVHWPTDTLAGLAIGASTGLVWGSWDPYSRLLDAASPALSLYAATAFTGALLVLLLAVRKAVPPVPTLVASTWYDNAIASLSPEEREATLANPRRMLRPRSLRSKIPMLVTVWATLAITAAYPRFLPSAAAEPLAGSGPLQALVGMAGLAAVAVIKAVVEQLRIAQGEKLVVQEAPRVRNFLKGLTYASICSWTFLLSQRLTHALRALLF